MDYDILFNMITRLCGEMISAGGACDMVPYRMNAICQKYGYTESEFIVNPNSVLAAAKAPDGTHLTAICSVDEIGQNFGKLHRLDEYCRHISKTLPSSGEIDRELQKIRNEKYLSKPAEYLASVFLGTGFAALFGCSITDTVIAAIACVLIVFIGSLIKKTTANLFFRNSVICLAVESVILLLTKYGLCQHPESVSLGVIMLLISGLSFSNGLWFLINKDTSIGIYTLCNSVIGAIGIVVGTAAPLALLKNEVVIQGLSVSSPVPVQVLLCVLACGGFGVLCCIDKKRVPAAALGAGLAWLVYALTSRVIPYLFLCMASATLVETVYAKYISARLEMIPNITHNIGILPLVPGSNLFYMLYGFVTRNETLRADEGIKLIITCLGISFGFSLGMLFIRRHGIKLEEKPKE